MAHGLNQDGGWEPSIAAADAVEDLQAQCNKVQCLAPATITISLNLMRCTCRATATVKLFAYNSASD